MRHIVLSAALALSLLAPLAARAQTAAPPPAPAAAAAPAPASEAMMVLRPGQLLAVGAGIVAGALVLQVAVPTRFGALVGAVLGGYLGNLWYTGRQLELSVATPKA